jgi:hypothetical protein
MLASVTGARLKPHGDTRSALAESSPRVLTAQLRD